MVTLAWVASSSILLLFIHGCSSSVLDLGNMLKITTGRSPLDFVNYGNWCGLGGGGYPLDDIDRCCQMHDYCYDKASATVCLDEKPHLTTYKWKYAAGKIHCNKADHPCGIVSCRCDAKFSACVSIHQLVYDPHKKRTRHPLLNLLPSVIVQIQGK